MRFRSMQLKAIGVGVDGCRAIDAMQRAGIEGVEVLVADADAQVPEPHSAPEQEQLRRSLSGADVVFVVAGIGSAADTGAAPVVARVARELGAFTVGLVTMPLDGKGDEQQDVARDGLDLLRTAADAVLLVPAPHARILEGGRDLPLRETLRIADDVVSIVVRAIAGRLNPSGLRSADFADVRNFLAPRGEVLSRVVLVGVGRSSGPARALEATRAALARPLLEEAALGSATSLLVTVAGGPGLTSREVNEAAGLIADRATSEEFLIDPVIDESLDDDVLVTVIAIDIGVANPRPTPGGSIPGFSWPAVAAGGLAGVVLRDGAGACTTVPRHRGSRARADRCTYLAADAAEDALGQLHTETENCSQRILVVEHDADLRDALQLTLETAGFDVRVVTTREEALNRLQTSSRLPDFVLARNLDAQKRPSGVPLAQAMWTDPRLANCPVILASARSEREVRAVTPFPPNIKGFWSGGAIDGLHELLRQAGDALDGCAPFARLEDTTNDVPMTFDTFLVDDTNRAVRKMVLEAARGQAGQHLVFGPSSTGKTHLLAAAESEARLLGLVVDRASPWMEVAPDEFARRWRESGRCDLLLIDDMHRLDGKTAPARRWLAMLREHVVAGGAALIAFGVNRGDDMPPRSPLAGALLDAPDARVATLVPPGPGLIHRALSATAMRYDTTVPPDIANEMVAQASDIPSVRAEFCKAWHASRRSGKSLRAAWMTMRGSGTPRSGEN